MGDGTESKSAESSVGTAAARASMNVQQNDVAQSGLAQLIGRSET